MSRALAFLCFALCLSAALAAEGPSTWAKDYLYSSSKASAQDYYGQREKATMCFNTASKCSRNNGKLEIDGLSCAPCPEAHYHKQYDDEEHEFAAYDVGSILAKCMWDTDLLFDNQTVALIGRPGWSWTGNFYATCYLEEGGKDHCELPEGCENTVVQIQGVVYNVKSAVRVGPPAATPVDVCTTDQVPSSLRKTSAKIQSAKSGYYYYENEPEHKVPAGPAMVYDGTFTVFGSHANKWREGRFQWTSFVNGTTPTQVADATGLPRFGDDIYKFEFLGEEKSRHYRLH